RRRLLPAERRRRASRAAASVGVAGFSRSVWHRRCYVRRVVGKARARPAHPCACDAAVRRWAQSRDVARRPPAPTRCGGTVILVVFGTTGELIKLAPVLLRLDERGHPYVLATTGQQVQQIPGFLEQFGLKQPDLWLGRGANGRDLRVSSDIPGWLG